MHLMQSNAGGGKTAYAISQILQQKSENPWESVWVLLPNELQINRFRDRLIATNRSNVLFGVQYFQFYQLYRYLLNRLHLSQRHINRDGVQQLLRRLLQDHPPRYFAPVVERPGFVQLLANFIQELKQSHIQPQAVQRFAEHTGRQKDLDLADIYARYQEYVTAANIVDREGAGWLALDQLSTADSKHFSDVCMLVVDGFLQVSPLQAKLIGELAEHIPATLITLTGSPDERPIHRAFNRLRDRLDKYTQHPITPQFLPPSRQRHPTLEHIETHFYSLSPDLPTAPATNVTLLEAAGHEDEVRGVLRLIKQRLLDGESPEEMLIVARDLNPYATLLDDIAEDYEVPIAFRHGNSLLHNPAIVAIIKLLRLAIEEFPRQAVIDTLRSPYFRIELLSAEDVDALEQISIMFKVMGGPEDWFTALEQAADAFRDEDGENRDPALLPDGLSERLQIFFERLVPPTAQSLLGCIAWLEDLLGPDPSEYREYIAEHSDPEDVLVSEHLQFFTQVRAGEPPAIAVRDMFALHAFRYCLQTMIVGRELARAQHTPLEWADFMHGLLQVVESQNSQREQNAFRHHSVLVTSATEARGLAHQHVYILGLAEGVFPALQSEDPLYSDRERERFEAFHKHEYDLQTTGERQDDAAVFYECVAQARDTLTLTRPTLDNNANPWPPSVLWTGVARLINNPQHIYYRAGQAPTLADAATLREAEVALIAALQSGAQAVEGVHVAQVLRWMQAENATRWGMIRHGQWVEARREDPTIGFDRYSGVLESPILRSIIAQRLGENHIWSASQFNDFGYCPFRFFANRLLRLQALEEPEEGMDAAQLGSLQHAILEDTYHQFFETELAISPENAEEAVRIMHAEADRIFIDAPRRFGFRETQLWQHEQDEIRRRLEALIHLDFSDDGESPFVRKKGGRKRTISTIAEQGERSVFRLESAFGIAGTPPVELHGPAGTIKARGFIDRIDRVNDQLIVIDYKSGTSTPSTSDMEAGRNFQMMLYILAAQQIVERETANDDLQVAAGMFWSIRSRKAGGDIAASAAEIESAHETLHHYVQGARAAEFPVQPSKLQNGKCMPYCEFYELCRIQRTHVRPGAMP
jgi:ATP-dependent helicase/nuclease subunit B